jgi:hypothetical protein
MNARIACLVGITAASTLLLAACGGSDHGGAPPVTMTNPPPPPPPMTTNLDTAAVLNIIQTQTSESADPFEVDNAAIAVTPVGDETSAPVPVDAT